MKKIIVRNLIDKRVWGEGAIYDDNQEKIFQENINNKTYGKPERWVRVDQLEDYEKTITPLETRESLDHDGKTFTEVKLPSDYTVEITDLEKDYDYLLSKCLQDRSKEMPKGDEVIEAIFEKFAENRSEKFDSLQLKRVEIKLKYPKPNK